MRPLPPGPKSPMAASEMPVTPQAPQTTIPASAVGSSRRAILRMIHEAASTPTNSQNGSESESSQENKESNT